MPVFAYRGLTPAGDPARGLLDADSVRAAWQALRTRGIYPTDITHDGAAATARPVPLPELASATRRAASLLAAKLPLTEALDATADLSSTDVAHALTRVAGRVREGATFTAALGEEPGTFPPLYRALVRAGEACGDLAGTLARLADHLDATVARRRRLVTALTYPAIVAATTGAVVIFLGVWVLPEVRTLVADAGGQLPWATRAVLALGDVAATAWWLGAPASVLVALGLSQAHRRGTFAGWTRHVASLPLVGPLVRDAAVARATHTLGTLLAAGVALDAAMPLAAEAGGPLLAPALGRVNASIREGRTFTHALIAANAFPALTVRLVATGDRIGALPASLLRAAELLESDTTQRLDRLTAWLEPVLVLGAGGLVLAVVAAVLAPILGLDPTGAR